MTGIGSITPSSLGAVTQPQVVRLVLPSANAKTAANHGLFSTIGLPGGRGQMMANGLDPLRHTLDENVLRTGLLAPRTALTATPTGAQATATLNLDVTGGGASVYNPSDGEQIVLIFLIEFKTTLAFPGSTPQIKIGATGADTLDNLQNFLENASGTKGVTWDSPSWWSDIATNAITVTQPQTWQLTATEKRYGSGGNGRAANLQSGTWTDCSLGSTGGTVGTNGYFAGGSDGAGTQPTAGSYRYRPAFYRSIDGAVSAVGTEATAQQNVDQNISLSAIPQPLEDDDIDYLRWLRTLNDGSLLYHGKDIEEGDITDTDELSNTDLATHTSYNAAIHRPYEAGMIERVRYLAEYKGRWVGGGHIRGSEYDHGTATVTNGSNAIVIAGGHVTKEMEHWTFNTNQSTEDDALDMEIVYVDEDNLTIYVHADWEGESSTSAPVAYTIKDTRDPFRLYYCEPVLPNQTSSTMFVDGVQSPDPAGLMGVVSAFESTVIFTKTGLWRMTGSEPVNFRLTHEYEGVGCVSGHSIIDTGDGVIYWLGDDGIYGWRGVGEPFEVSNPPTGQQAEVRGITRTIRRINARQASQAFGHYDAENRVARWFVPLDDAQVNTHAIVLDLQTTSWSLDKTPALTYVLTVSDESGDLRTLGGDVHGVLWELDISTIDGAYGFEPVQTVAAGATKRVFSVDGTPLPTSGDGLKGVPFVLIDSTGAFSDGTVYSNTNAQVTCTTALDAAPSDGDYVIFGGIHQPLQSGKYTYEQKSVRKGWDATKVMYAKQSTGEYWFSYAVDDGTPAVVELAVLTRSDGENHHWVRNEGRRHQMRFDVVGRGFAAEFQAIRNWIRPSRVDG